MLKVGIAGYGVVGKKRAYAINKNKNLKLVAVCDQTINKKKSMLNKGIYLYNNYTDLLNHDIDILIVCLTNDIAARVTIMGLKKKLHVFCEKPPATKMTDLKKVINIEKKNKSIKLKYGFNHRYHNSIIEAKKIVESKKYGKIINLKGTYGKSKLVTFDQSDWRTKRNIAGGGVLLDQGIHMLDLMLYFNDSKIATVKSFVENSFWKFDVEDNVYSIFKSVNGVISMINSSATQWKHLFSLEINMAKGSLILSGILSGSKSYGDEKLTIIETNHKNDNGNPKEITKKYNKDLSWEKEINEFTHEILLNKKISNGNSKDALKTFDLVQKIYHSDAIWRKKYNIKKT